MQVKSLLDFYFFGAQLEMPYFVGVGKTCLVRKFTQGVFPPGQSATIGVDFMVTKYI